MRSLADLGDDSKISDGASMTDWSSAVRGVGTRSLRVRGNPSCRGPSWTIRNRLVRWVTSPSPTAMLVAWSSLAHATARLAAYAATAAGEQAALAVAPFGYPVRLDRGTPPGSPDMQGRAPGIELTAGLLHAPRPHALQRRRRVPVPHRR